MRHSTNQYFAAVDQHHHLAHVALALVVALVLLMDCAPAYGQRIQAVASADLSLEQESVTTGLTQKTAGPFSVPELRKPLPELVYPVQAETFGIEGRVVVQFSLNEKGKVQDPQIVRGLGYGCDEEVLRVLRHGRFEVALDQAGQPQPAQYLMAFDFKLSEQ